MEDFLPGKGRNGERGKTMRTTHADPKLNKNHLMVLGEPLRQRWSGHLWDIKGMGI